MSKILLVFVVVLSCVLLEVSRATEENNEDEEHKFKQRLWEYTSVLFGLNYSGQHEPELFFSTDEQKNEIVQKAIKSLTKIIETFHSKFDKVKFPLLYDIIEEIEVYVNGFSKSDTEPISFLIHKTFKGIVLPVFEWCSNGISDDLYSVSASFVGEGKGSIFYAKLLMVIRRILQHDLIGTLHKVQGDYESNGRQGQKFTNGLKQKIRNASQMASQIEFNLREDEKNLDAFIKLFKSDDKVKELIKLKSNLQGLQKLERTCLNYTNWFKSDLKDYARNNEIRDGEINTEFRNDVLSLSDNMGDYFNETLMVGDDRLVNAIMEAVKYFTNKTQITHLVLDYQDYRVALKNGIESLANIIEKFPNGIDKKVKFQMLYEAINEIDKYASNYQGSAKNKLLNLRHFNLILRKVFQKCVTPVFEWCSNGYLDDINHVLRKHLTAGEENAARSINYLKVLLFQRSYVQRALNDTLRAVQEDGGPNGFYGKQGIQLTNGLEQHLRRTVEVAYQEDLGLDEDERNILAFLGIQPEDSINAWINRPVNLPSLQKLANACRNYKIWFESGLKEYAPILVHPSNGEVGPTSKVPTK